MSIKTSCPIGLLDNSTNLVRLSNSFEDSFVNHLSVKLISSIKIIIIIIIIIVIIIIIEIYE